ncbi:Homeodomain-like domain-containing protein [Halopseudomonas litoralis]|uniref:Homeodomain-like domain-containing protein n=1 Tax=Halopseudomonas litoralis TaxID=797277 RepID=A0A1H1S914_9GAMM|nr:helix-turn-helix domain-containing protein [Halopseudomonas litoralis]SDS44431.1 Homeodomain-like domain-containing protein [Halopseudomonas litoralis]
MKQVAITLIDEAVEAGARKHTACAVLGLTDRTLRRWQRSETLIDQRKGAVRKASAHALTAQEKEQILAVCNSPEHQSLPPSQIVPRLADQGFYIASESSFYRVLREHEQAHHRGRAAAPRTLEKPQAWVATAPNQVWSWDSVPQRHSGRKQGSGYPTELQAQQEMVVGPPKPAVGSRLQTSPSCRH